MITEKEKELLNKIIGEYQEIHNDLFNLEKNLLEITSKKTEVLRKLNSLKTDEFNLLASLREKYGEDFTADQIMKLL